MSVTLPSSGYISNSARTKGELKTSLEELRDAIETVDTNADDNSSDISALGTTVSGLSSTVGTHVADSNIHVTSIEKAKLVYGQTFIATQSQFDTVFDGTTLSDAYYYLVDNGTPYNLNNEIPLGSNLTIDGDPGVIIIRNGQYRFHSTGVSGTPISDIVITSNVIFDGNGGINPDYSGSTTFTGNGGFCSLTYTENSKFEARVTNCLVSGNGGAYYDDGTSSCIKIKNVFYNSSNAGGGVYGLNYSVIENIYNNYATTVGGGLRSCDNCTIENVHDNSCGNASGGDGLSYCDNSYIKNIYDNNEDGVVACVESIIMNVYGHSTSGVNSCTKSIIRNVYDNAIGVTTCTYSDISNVFDNTGNGVVDSQYAEISNVYSNGGSGVVTSSYSNISNVYNNGGHGVTLCDYCSINVVHGNTNYGINESDYCTITNISYNDFGCVDCNDCKISNVHNNTMMGVITNERSFIDTVHNNGQSGCATLYNCTISNVYSNTNHGVSNANSSVISNVYLNTQSGCSTCSECTISGLYNNVEYGCTNCSSCTISNIEDNTLGGVLDGSGNCFLGRVSGNGGTYQITNSTTSIAFIHGGTATVLVQTTSTTINW